MNQRLLQALSHQPLDRFPVWLMRQAGRYLPSYQKLRQTATLKKLFTTKELIVEATLLPLDPLAPDAAILFSDITIIALAMGLNLDFKEGIGPVIWPKMTDFTALKKLTNTPEALEVIGEAIVELKKQLTIPLIGFCGAPFTVACYFSDKKHLYRCPESFQLLLRKITDTTKEYLRLQITKGVDVIQIFDSSAYLLPEHLFRKWSLPYLQELEQFVRSFSVPTILFARGSCLYWQDLASLAPTAISFDWHKSLTDLRKQIPQNIVVQGNFDPDLLYAPPKQIAKVVANTLAGVTKKSVIINLGHGLKPDMPLEHVQAFVEAVKCYG